MWQEPDRADPLPLLGRVVSRKRYHDLAGLAVIEDHYLADPLLTRRVARMVSAWSSTARVRAIRLSNFRLLLNRT